MDKHEAKQILKRVNELHFDLEALRQKQNALQQDITFLKNANFPVGLIHADFLENSGRYVFLDDVLGR